MKITGLVVGLALAIASLGIPQATEARTVHHQISGAYALQRGIHTGRSACPAPGAYRADFSLC